MDLLKQVEETATAAYAWAVAQPPMFWVGMACCLLVYLTIGCVLAYRWTTQASRESPVELHDASASEVLGFILLVLVATLGLMLLWPLVVLVRFLVRLGQTLAKEIK